ncbi:hypothetical protein ACQ86G_00290 [Roseateles chitinivorans]|uniref:hypothetical protein n=1 Tax=Roseateles chitinivorans TaxID=2917965 RepID=UPI003D665EC0
MKQSIGLCGLAAVLFAPFAATASPDALCRPDETVKYHCLIGEKSASLCAAPASGEVRALTYRFGTAEKVELEYTAAPDNGKTFSAFSQQIDPRARINQVWFDRGNVRYLMTECSGGTCTSDGRLSVVRGEKVVMNAECRNPLSDPPSFSRDLVQFGPRREDARSFSPLLKWAEAANPVEALYESESSKRGD